MKKDEKIVEERNQELMFANLPCIRKIKFHRIKSKAFVHNLLFRFLLYFQSIRNL